MLETLPMWSDVQPQLQPHHQLHEDIETREPPGRESPEQWRSFQPGFRRPYCTRPNAIHALYAMRDARPTVSFAIRHQEIRFARSPREPKTLHAHIVRAQWSAEQFIAIKVGIGRHSEHFVARNILSRQNAVGRRRSMSCKSNHCVVGEAGFLLSLI